MVLIGPVFIYVGGIWTWFLARVGWAKSASLGVERYKVPTSVSKIPTSVPKVQTRVYGTFLKCRL